MDNNNPWYNVHNSNHRHRSNGHHHPQQPPINNVHMGTFSVNSPSQGVQDAQQLLASYPMASATPTMHSVRHLAPMHTTAAPPTYVQPSYYSPQPNHTYSNGHQASPQGLYAEYDQRLSYLSAPQVPVDSRADYWHAARDQSVRLLNEQSTRSNPYPEPPRHHAWPASSYQTTPFAQSVFERTPSGSAYPTPPPAISHVPQASSSFSSLAHALDVPVQRARQPVLNPPPPPPPQAPPHVPPTYTAQESATFFDQFLQRKTQELKPVVIVPQYPPRAAQPQVQPRQSYPAQAQALPGKPTFVLQPPIKAAPVPPIKFHKTPLKQEPAIPASSPDPLALKSEDAPLSVTPQKRKMVVEIQSSPSKRLQSYKPLSSIPHLPNLLGGTQPRTPKTSFPTTPSKNAVQTASRPPTSASSSTSVTSMASKPPMTPSPKRTVNKAFVLVPPSPYLTPSSRKGQQYTDTPDLGGYGSNEDTPLHKRRIMSSAARTGDRDDRGPLEKFLSIVEDIFESEDSLPTELGPEDLPHDFFSALSTDCTQPLLSTSIIRKLLKYIGQVAQPTKRMRQAGASGPLATPSRKSGRMVDVEVQTLSRLLKMLDRTVQAGQDLNPFQQTSGSSSASMNGTVSARNSPVKKSRKPKKVKDNADDDDAMDGVEEEAEESQRSLKKESSASSFPTETELDTLTRVMDQARDSVMAADCCIAILTSDRLPKQLYSEELIMSCLNAVKNQMAQILFPFVEGTSPDITRIYNATLLHHLLKNDYTNDTRHSATSQAHHRKQMSELFQALSAALPRVNALANAGSVAMSSDIIIKAVYIAVGPFFIVEGGEESTGKSSKKEKETVVNKILGKSAMRGLRLDALALIRSIFSNHEEQRSWIIEEILTSLIKLSDSKQKVGQFRLRDGQSIRTPSALLLQLVQTSAHNVRVKARRLEKDRMNRLALKRQESLADVKDQSEEPFLDDLDTQEIELYGAGLDSAIKAAHAIVIFLNSRAGKGKATKTSNEAEYRAIFDNLIEDLLVVLYWPEWPAASLLLGVACKYMVKSLQDVKSSNTQADSNAAKTMALDHVGVIAARIRSNVLKAQKAAEEGSSSHGGLKTLDEIVSSMKSKPFAHFMDVHRDVAAHLCKRASEDQAYESARELMAAFLGQELANALKRVNSWLEQPEGDEDLNLRDSNKLLSFGQKLKIALREVWKDPSTDVFDVGSQDEISRIDKLAEEIGAIQSLTKSFHNILNVVLMALDAPAIFMRTKALRALGQIVTVDATILSAANVRQGIENHLLDSSPAVRDAAVELIGKYMVDSREVAGNYYPKIAERMADTGLAVRKRVIKLLKSFYTVTDDKDRKIDISFRLVLRMMDEDDGVKELAIKTLEEIWFPPTPLPSTLKGKASSPGDDQAALLAKVSIIMGTAANFRDRQNPLEDVLHKIIAEKDGHEAAVLHKRYKEICETLIDGLVDASDLPGFSIINCIRTIYLFTAAYPPVLSGSNASTLLPYLKNASTPEELITSDYLLKIFRVSVPHMPKTAAKFGQDLQGTLQPMILKPTGGGVQILQEAVGCMCAVVQHLTHDFKRLINLLKGCNARLLDFGRRPPSKQLAPNEVKAMLILIFIVALLGEHCNFDRLRLDHADLVQDIDAITQGSIMEHIYGTLLAIYDKYDNSTVRGRILQCLGFLFRAQPTLMTQQDSAAIMDAIFASDEEEGRARLLKIMQDFLISESEKHTAKEKESVKGKNKANGDVNMDELVGNTDGFADSGVSSAIVQRYLQHILEAALSQNVQIQNAAIDVLTFTIKQGLAHPLQSFPVIIALETSPSPHLNGRATALHSILNSKHASLLNTRYSQSARTSFDYQRKITDGAVQGFRIIGHPVALLQRWYSLAREKRQSRQEFLKNMVKVFSEHESYEANQDDVDFIRYMAENFATFEYKTQEEVITVIKSLTTVLSTTGMQLLEIISPSHLLTHLQTQENGQESAVSSVPQAPTRDPLALMRTSVIVAIVMLLKSYLKTLYSLSEDKCAKFVLNKKSAVGDKQAVKRHDQPITWEKLPFATTPIHSTHDADEQKRRFLEIWNEDGVTAEPEDEEFL